MKRKSRLPDFGRIKIWRYCKQSTSVKIVLALFITLTLMILLSSALLYVQGQNSAKSLHNLPEEVQAKIAGYMGSLTLHLLWFAALLVPTICISLLIIVEIVQRLIDLISRLLARLLRLNPQFQSTNKVVNDKASKKINLRYMLIVCMSIFIPLFIYLSVNNSNMAPLYLIFVFCLIIALFYTVGLMKIDVQLVKQLKGISKSDLAKYENYSLLQVVILAIFSAVGIGCILYIIHYSSLFYSNIVFTRFSDLTDAFFVDLHNQYSQYFTVSLDEVKLRLTTFRTEILNVFNVERLLPDSILHLALAVGLLVLIIWGIGLNIVLIKHLHGTKKVMGFVFIPLLTGCLFYVLSLVMPLESKGIITTSIIVIGLGYLLGIVTTRMGKKVYSITCPNPECNSQNDSDAVYCQYCGTVLKDGEIKAISE